MIYQTVGQSFLNANTPKSKAAKPTTKNGMFLNLIILKYKWYIFLVEN